MPNCRNTLICKSTTECFSSQQMPQSKFGQLLQESIVERYSDSYQVSIIELEIDSRSSKLKEFYNNRGFKKNLYPLVEHKLKMTKLIR